MIAASVLRRLVGRNMAWRVGRALYMSARQELGNAIDSNGEVETISRVLAAHRKIAPGRPFLAFDVGANLGDWTQALLNGVNGDADVRVEVFEPVPATFARLEQRFGSDRRVHLNRSAISGRVGEAEMTIVGETAGTNSLNPLHGVEGKRIIVPLTTLDAHLEGIGATEAALVKIDAEGHDIEILRSLPDMIRRRAFGVLQFEYNHRWLVARGSLSEVFELVEGSDYQIGRVTPGGPDLFEGWNPELDRYFEANYALVRTDFAQAAKLRKLRWSASNVAVPV